MDLVGIPFVVIVKETNRFAIGEGCSVVPCFGSGKFRKIKMSYSKIVLIHPIFDIVIALSTVVYEDDVVQRMILIHDGLQRTAYHVGFTVVGDDDGCDLHVGGYDSVVYRMVDSEEWSMFISIISIEKLLNNFTSFRIV